MPAFDEFLHILLPSKGGTLKLTTRGRIPGQKPIHPAMIHRYETDPLPNAPGLTSPSSRELFSVDLCETAPRRLSNQAQPGIAKELLPDYRMDTICPNQQVTLHFASVGKLRPYPLIILSEAHTPGAQLYRWLPYSLQQRHLEVATVKMKKGYVLPVANVINLHLCEYLSAHRTNNTISRRLSGRLYCVRQSNLPQRFQCI